MGMGKEEIALFKVETEDGKVKMKYVLSLRKTFYSFMV
jgi:hypothetical protein